MNIKIGPKRWLAICGDDESDLTFDFTQAEVDAALAALQELRPKLSFTPPVLQRPTWQPPQKKRPRYNNTPNMYWDDPHWDAPSGFGDNY